MKKIFFLFVFFFICIDSITQENNYEGIYYTKEIQKGNGFSCFSINKNQTILHVIITKGSFNHIWEEKYTIVGDTITTEDGWIIILSEYKKADRKMIDKIEKEIGGVLSSHGYCIYKNCILRCSDINGSVPFAAFF